jgi:sporulation protein YlmC with PRC-barrel domain
MTMIHLRSMGLLIALSVLSSPAIAQGSGSSDALQPPPPTAGEIAPLGAWSPEFDSNSGTSLNAILNMEVFSSEGRKIGQIDNVLFDADGQAEAVIARVGGFSGITDGQVSVAWKFLEINASSRRITMPITLENCCRWIAAACRRPRGARVLSPPALQLDSEAGAPMS